MPGISQKQNAGVAEQAISSKKQNAGVAERQTRWFQVPVSRDVWVQIPSSAPCEDTPTFCRGVFALYGDGI